MSVIYAEDTTVASNSQEFSTSFLGGVDGDHLEVAFFWKDQILSVSQYADAVKVGDDPECHDIIAPGLDFPKPLIANHVLTVHESMTTYINNDAYVWTLDDFIAEGHARSLGRGWFELDLGQQYRAQVIWDDFMFLVRYSDRLAANKAIGFDRDPIPFVGVSAFTHILMLMLIFAIPENAGALELDGHLANDRFVQLALEPEQHEPLKPDWLDSSEDSQASAAHAGEEGQAGDPEETKTKRRLAIKGPTDNEDIQIKKLRDQQIAMSAGIAGTFEAQLASTLGTSDASIGADAQHAVGNLDGRDVGASAGFGGLGVTVGRHGGGGIVEGSLGLTRVATKGRHTGDGRYGKGHQMEDREATTPGEVIPQPPTLYGSLDREIVKRVIRKQRRALKACYEAELQKNRRLSGEVVVKFTISGQGNVISARTESTTLKNAKVESCVNKRIRRFIFPEPNGGGLVVVRYPFRFSAN
jgi:TonB family protein